MKKEMKRGLAAVMTAALLLPQMAIAAEPERELLQASQTRPWEGKEIQDISAADLKEQNEILMELDQTVREVLLDAEDEEISVDLTGMELEVGRDDYINKLKYISPYCNSDVTLQIWYDGSYYSDLEIITDLSKEERNSHVEEADAKVADILSWVTGDMTDAEKLLAVHDYFVADFAYDLYGGEGEEAYQCGGIFRNRTGVCQAYAYGYLYIMNKLGIECYFANSPEMGHAWNIVKADGNYYHVDCTWDDPVEDTLGAVSHQYFLLSDETMQDEKATSQVHTGWDLTMLPCTSKSYENAYWKQAFSRVIQLDGSSYYMKTDGVYRRDLSNGREQKLADVGIWNTWGSDGWYEQPQSGLSIYRGELYYNTSTEIRKMALDGTGNTLVYRPDTSDGYVYGSHISGGTLEYMIKQDPWMEGEKIAAPVDLDSLAPADPDELPFQDVRNGDWFYDSAKYVYDKNIMTGLDTITFGPGEQLKRAQLAVILHRMNEEPEMTYSALFPDVPDGQWFTDAILWAADAGVVTGYSDTGFFGTGDNINREQIATMMYRYARYKGYSLEDAADFSSYPDAAYVNEFAEEAMAWAVGNGIITGKENPVRLDPQGLATRAECATIIMRFMETFEK